MSVTLAATEDVVHSRSGIDKLGPAYEDFHAEPFAKDTPSWLLELRREGEAHVRAQGLPTRALESWKYTDLRLLLEGTWQISESFSQDELPERNVFPKYQGEMTAELVILNGRFLREWSSNDVGGIDIRTASQLAAKPDAISATRNSIQSSLNASFLRDVITIDIAPGTVFKKPLVISMFSFGVESLTKWSASAPRVVINVGVGCEVAIVEFFGGDGRTVNMPVTILTIGRNSRVSHVRLNVNQASGVQLGSARISLARDSFCETFQFTLSGRLSREELAIDLCEPGAEAVLNGLYLANGSRVVDHFTSVDHLAPQTTSAQLYKGILKDNSRGVFNGRVHIHRHAQRSNASQLNHNLLLSRHAEIDTKPELEIDADDVKASHGATTGRIDPEHIFYLRARAISESDAVQMLAKGFAQDVAFRIQNEFIRSTLEDVVSKALVDDAR